MSVLSEIEHEWVPLFNDGKRTVIRPEVGHKLVIPYANYDEPENILLKNYYNEV